MLYVITTDKIFKEWPNVHHVLADVMDDLLDAMGEYFGATATDQTVVTLTSLNRPKTEDDKLGGSGIHVVGPPWRAVDVAFKSWEEAQEVAALVNAKWIYDPKRPQMKVAYAKKHGTGPHIHLQVHPRTIKIVDDDMEVA